MLRQASAMLLFLSTMNIIRASKLRTWFEKDSFVTGLEPSSGQVMISLNARIFVFSGSHGSGFRKAVM